MIWVDRLVSYGIFFSLIVGLGAQINTTTAPTIVSSSGAVTSGHCPQFASAGVITDSGAACSGGGGTTYTAPPTTGWSWVNQSTSVVTNTAYFSNVDIPNNVSLNWRLQTRSTPATPYTLTVFYRSIFQIPAASSQGSGIYFYDGTKLLGIELLSQSGPAYTLRVERITNVTTDGSTVFSQTGMGAFGPNGGGMWLRVANDGANISFSASADGITFTSLYSEAVAAFITPTSIGYGGVSVAGSGAGISTTLISWNGIP